jgi:putative endonuclease
MRVEVSASKGKLYEDIAAAHMRGLGYEILARNWHAGRYGELDLVCRDGEVLVLIEVKGRSSGRHWRQDALSSVNPTKARRLWHAAELYMQLLEQEGNSLPGARFDVVLVADNGRVEHITDVSLE